MSELFQKGVDLGTIQHLYTGHGSSYMTELYAKADMNKKRVDLSNLARITTEEATPKRNDLSEQDQKAFDEINLMDAPKPVKIFLKGLTQFKRTEELEIIRDWLNKRIEGLIVSV